MVSRLFGIFRRRNRIDDECEEIRQLSSDFIDEDLGASASDTLKAHLSRCGPCNTFVNTLRATVNLLRATPMQQAPPGFQDRLRQNLRQDPPK